MSRFSPAPLLAVLTLALSLAACENDVSPIMQTPETVSFAPVLGVNLDSMVHTGSGLYYRDLVVGEGEAASAGKLLGVQYGGFLANGTNFELQTTGIFQFRLGAGEVIKGWDQGLAGLRIGGRRQLVIPPSLGYGSTPNGPIPANSVLVFTVDLLTVSD